MRVLPLPAVGGVRFPRRNVLPKEPRSCEEVVQNVLEPSKDVLRLLKHLRAPQWRPWFGGFLP